MNGGKEFVFNFMENFIYNGVAPFGKVIVINAGVSSVSVNVSTPLVTSGTAHVDRSITIDGGQSWTFSLPPDTSLTGIGKEFKGGLQHYCAY